MGQTQILDNLSNEPVLNKEQYTFAVSDDTFYKDNRLKYFKYVCELCGSVTRKQLRRGRPCKWLCMKCHKSTTMKSWMSRPEVKESHSRIISDSWKKEEIRKARSKGISESMRSRPRESWVESLKKRSSTIESWSEEKRKSYYKLIADNSSMTRKSWTKEKKDEVSKNRSDAGKLRWKNATDEQKKRWSDSFVGNRFHKLEYDKRKFDSNWEIEFYKCCQEKGVTPEQNFGYLLYECEGRQKRYYPDFKVGETIIEIKGPQFFDKETGNMICPYQRSDDKEYEAKHQCMIKNNVVILKSLEEIHNYVECFL